MLDDNLNRSLVCLIITLLHRAEGQKFKDVKYPIFKGLVPFTILLYALESNSISFLYGSFTSGE